MSQEKAHRPAHDDSADAEPEPARKEPDKRIQADIDRILEEFDEVIADNLVKFEDFVQKGGQ